MFEQNLDVSSNVLCCGQDRERFWYIEDVDLTTLFPLFMAWAKTMGSSLRKELTDIGDALHEARMDEVSRGIQYVFVCVCVCGVA